MAVPHPWRAIPPRVEVRFADLPRGVRGLTNGATIWLHHRLSQRERRSTLAHELEHVRRDHRDEQPEVVEQQVRIAAARWLLPDIHVVGEALAWTLNLDEAADELWVDRMTLRTRLEHLHPSERHYLKRRLEHHD